MTVTEIIETTEFSKYQAPKLTPEAIIILTDEDVQNA